MFYSSAGRNHSQVSGHIKEYQLASPNGLNVTLTKNIGLESYYLYGISLRGAPGSREHIWSFVNAYNELTPGNTTPQWVCPCMYSNSSEWPYNIPSFIGNNYLCATGNRGGPAMGLLMIVCGMVLDAEEQALVADSTHHHGSAHLYLQLLLLILK